MRPVAALKAKDYNEHTWHWLDRSTRSIPLEDSAPGSQASQKPPEERLDSWKEIAAYLKRDITTVQRWEKREGMPVHRHVHDKRGSVYALGSELDAWLSHRRATLGNGQRGEQETALPSTVRPARRWLALGSLAAIAALAIAYSIYPRRRAGAVSTASAANQKIKSLAVLPLKNLSADPSQEYLADGMTEALIGKLSNLHDLRVISHTSVMRFRDPQITVPEIAKLLHVDAIVEGSVIRQGNRVRVTAELIRGATDDHFWSQAYDRELRDVLALQSDVAQSITEKVQATVTGEEQERLSAARPVAPEVYDSYLLGWSALNRSYLRSDIEQSIGDFNAAIKQDSTFAPAYLGLATAYYELSSNFVGDQPDADRRQVVANAQKALQLDPNSADAHVLIADMLQKQWRWADAKSEYLRAIELNPNDADAHAGFAEWLLCEGHADEAIDWARRARELDPIEIDGKYIGILLLEARRYDEAVHELRSALAVQPDEPVALWDIGIALVVTNRPAEAIPLLEKARSLSKDSPGVTGQLVAAYARAGRRKDALHLLAEMQDRKKSGYVPASAFVIAYLGLGDREQTFAWLAQAYNEHSSILQYLKVDPIYDPLRSDPRFAALVHRAGLDHNI